MAIIITEECINCDACISECPNNAIYEPDTPWTYADGSKLKGKIKNLLGADVDASEEHDALSDESFYIVPEKCTECKGFHDTPQCASVCPVDCCVPDDNHKESDADLLKKKSWLHAE